MLYLLSDNLSTFHRPSFPRIFFVAAYTDFHARSHFHFLVSKHLSSFSHSKWSYYPINNRFLFKRNARTRRCVRHVLLRVRTYARLSSHPFAIFFISLFFFFVLVNSKTIWINTNIVKDLLRILLFFLLPRSIIEQSCSISISSSDNLMARYYEPSGQRSNRCFPLKRMRLTCLNQMRETLISSKFKVSQIPLECDVN